MVTTTTDSSKTTGSIDLGHFKKGREYLQGASESLASRPKPAEKPDRIYSELTAIKDRMASAGSRLAKIAARAQSQGEEFDPESAIAFMNELTASTHPWTEKTTTTRSEYLGCLSEIPTAIDLDLVLVGTGFGRGGK